MNQFTEKEKIDLTTITVDALLNPPMRRKTRKYNELRKHGRRWAKDFLVECATNPSFAKAAGAELIAKAIEVLNGKP